MSGIFSNELILVVSGQCAINWYGVHGPGYLARVLANGVHLRLGMAAGFSPAHQVLGDTRIGTGEIFLDQLTLADKYGRG
jgi:hypothetical protein